MPILQEYLHSKTYNLSAQNIDENESKRKTTNDQKFTAEEDSNFANLDTREINGHEVRVHIILYTCIRTSCIVHTPNLQNCTNIVVLPEPCHLLIGLLTRFVSWTCHVCSVLFTLRHDHDYYIYHIYCIWYYVFL